MKSIGHCPILPGEGAFNHLSRQAYRISCCHFRTCDKHTCLRNQSPKNSSSIHRCYILFASVECIVYQFRSLQISGCVSYLYVFQKQTDVSEVGAPRPGGIVNDFDSGREPTPQKKPEPKSGLFEPEKSLMNYGNNPSF